MRLTIINQYYVPDVSPTAHLAASVAEHRASRSDEVTVVTSNGGYAEIEGSDPDKNINNLRVIRIWTPRLSKSGKLTRVMNYLIFYLFASLRMFFLQRQDVIISLTTPPFIALTAVAHKLLHPSTKIILWNMDCYPEIAEKAGAIKAGGLVSGVLRSLNKVIFRRLDHVVCLDGAMEKLLRESNSPTRKKSDFSVIPNWEKECFFPPDIYPPAWEKSKHLGLEDKFVILYLGNAGFGHDFSLVIEAAKQLVTEPVCFLFVGGGAKYDTIARAIEASGLENILLEPYVNKEQTPSVMNCADCALITMQDFALGLVSPSKLHSSLAMSLPVIYVGPRGSNVDEAIKEFNCGISLRGDETRKFVQFVLGISKDKNDHVLFRRNARKAFEAAYCDKIALDQFDQVLQVVKPH